MRKAVFGALAILSGAVLVAWRTTTPAISADEAAIRETVGHYFAGIMQNSAVALSQVFYAEAHIMAYREGRGMYDAPFEEWVLFTTRRNAPENPSAYENTIASIDIAGNAAVAKINFQWPLVHFVEYLSLLRMENGEWKIVNKIYMEELLKED